VRTAPPCPPHVIDAINSAMKDAYIAGLKDGLAVAENIRGWLTREPDTNRQAEARAWADAAIERAKKRVLL